MDHIAFSPAQKRQIARYAPGLNAVEGAQNDAAASLWGRRAAALGRSLYADERPWREPTRKSLTSRLNRSLASTELT